MPKLLEKTNVKLRKWGNGNAVGITSFDRLALGLEEGEILQKELYADYIILRPQRDPKKYPTLKEMIDSIDPKNLHEYVDFGPPVGKERWWEDEGK